jgi:hypothetical protein
MNALIPTTTEETPEIEIFKVGRHTSGTGLSQTYTAEFCNEVIMAFNQSKAPVPVVLGHPKDDAPAYGWVKSLRLDGGIMKARVYDLDPAFVDMVKAGKYKRVSSAFFNPDSSANPSPGKYALRHIGFLGAKAPAVTGLKPVQFSDAGVGLLEFGDSDINGLPADLMRRLTRVENERLLEEFQRQGKILPWAKRDLLEFMDTLSGDELMFSEKAGTTDPLDWFRGYLGKLPTLVTLGKMNFSAAPDEEKYDAYDLPAGYSVDPKAMKLRAKAQKIAADTGCSFDAALKEAQRG